MPEINYSILFRLFFQVQCAVPVLIPCSEAPGLGVQHLWVCSGDKGRSQVTVASLHLQQPCVVESFRACDAVVMCVEAVPGCAGSGKTSGDTVWMGTDEHEYVQFLCVYFY